MGTRTNPYVGPSPFEQEDGPFFYGRDSEANELYSMICAHSVVLCYSQSGAGKTSLLNARIIPRLREQKAEVLNVVRVGVKLPKEATDKKIANIFVFNTLLSLQGKQEQIALDNLVRMSLAEYLKQQKFNGTSEYFYPLHVVVFDQFEELFTSFPEHWEKREGFFLNINQALEADPLLRVVFAMREEYIAKLEPFAPMLPQSLQKRFRLERLRKEAAMRAVDGPLERMREAKDPLERTERYYKRGVVDKLVNNLLQEQIEQRGETVSMTGEFVEPVQLQIVCQSLWDALPPEVKAIDKQAVAEFGDVDTALARYYDESLNKVVAADPRVKQEGLRAWFEKSLITPTGTRGIVYMGEGRTEDNLSEPVVKLLEDRRLIRAELRGGAKWYELTHDRFIEPILKSNQAWSKRLPEDDKFIYELEQRATTWKVEGRADESLLTDEELRKVRQALERHARRKDELSNALNEYISASELGSAKRQRKALILRVSYIAITAIIGVTLVLSTVYSRLKASKADLELSQIRKGNQAKEFSSVRGSEYNALALGIEAVGSKKEDAPIEAVNGLRTALAAIGNKVWLPYSTTQPVQLQLSPDGKLALTASGSEFVVWDSVTGQRLFGFSNPDVGEWRQRVFSPDGKFLFTVGTPKTNPNDPRLVLALDARSGKSADDLQGKLQGARGIQVSDNGRYLLADIQDNLKIVDLASLDIRSPFPVTQQQQWFQIALSPDGSRLAAVYGDTEVQVLAADSGQVLGSFRVGVPKIAGQRDYIAFSPDGKRGVLARPSSATGETIVLVWSDSESKPLVSFKTKGEPVQAAISADGNSVVVIGMKGATIYNIERQTKDERPLPVGYVASSGTRVLLLQNEGESSKVLAWDALTGETKTLAQADASKYKFMKAAMTPDAGTVITHSADGVIQVWAVNESLDFGKLTVEELFHTACEKLRAQREYAQVSDLCKETP